MTLERLLNLSELQQPHLGRIGVIIMVQLHGVRLTIE